MITKFPNNVLPNVYCMDIKQKLYGWPLFKSLKNNLLPQYFFKLKIKGRLQYLEKPSYRFIVTDIIRNIVTVCMTVSCILVTGVVCSLGHEIRSVWRKILDGKCGITKIINPGTWSRSLERSIIPHWLEAIIIFRHISVWNLHGTRLLTDSLCRFLVWIHQCF